MPDDNRAVVPPLPIPNRTVKRRIADDSEHLARESRTLSGTLREKPTRAYAPGGFLHCFGADSRAGSQL